MNRLDQLCLLKDFKINFAFSEEEKFFHKRELRVQYIQAKCETGPYRVMGHITSTGESLLPSPRL